MAVGADEAAGAGAVEGGGRFGIESGGLAYACPAWWTGLSGEDIYLGGEEADARLPGLEVGTRL